MQDNSMYNLYDMQYEKHLKTKNTHIQMKYLRYLLKYIHTLKIYKVINFIPKSKANYGSSKLR